MKVHNLMEEFVKSRVDDLYDQLKVDKPVWLNCDCENCRMDAISYVLNRVPPKYVVSSIGVTHANADLNKTQIRADVDKLAFDAIKLVNSSKRPFHSQSYISDVEKTVDRKPHFVFPTFTGAILDGTTFEPIGGAEIVLKLNGQNAEMIDKTWSNPSKSSKEMNGVYSFCVKPEVAGSEGENKSFDFAVCVSAEGYEPTTYAFTVPSVSKIQTGVSLTEDYSLKIQDLFLFPVGLENEMERYIPGDESEM